MTDGPLDRELISEYQIMITASDLGLSPLSTSGRTVHCWRYSKLPSTSQQLYVAENNEPRTYLGQVFARNPHLGENSLFILHW